MWIGHFTACQIKINIETFVWPKINDFKISLQFKHVKEIYLKNSLWLKRMLIFH
jgi:hypothetical protein